MHRRAVAACDGDDRESPSHRFSIRSAGRANKTPRECPVATESFNPSQFTTRAANFDTARARIVTARSRDREAVATKLVARALN
jgi:hypothetical protein